ncbi:heat-inducible transcriptional repressor HrcA [Hydromonas duriensis]|uniref:Heat-inducible transcription repressor HrcA n=1 Tax=Hydromonas duriensis TaxID=1527608 RepID=A0A4R6Y2M3_9BURK|nr:heat-inducible transcriptional repressor HrcA [Hydromonas duriensis]TDR30594.1 heat-inducible transcription repressor HrcA [Hydromonas duriensis]
MHLDDRAHTLLTTLVSQYITQGQPVGSGTLAQQAGLKLSPATVRHVLADLEHMGLISSPHTSAGRVPTPQGYRFFVDAMMTASAFETIDDSTFRSSLQPDSAQRLVSSAVQLLSHISKFAGVISTPKRSQVFRHIEFLLLSPQRVLAILITPEGDVQNRLLELEYPYQTNDLVAAANYLNTHCAGRSLEQIHYQLSQELHSLQERVTFLMQAAVSQNNDTPSAQDDAVIVRGERHLLDVSEFANDMNRLRQTFDLFDEKNRLLQLLERTNHAGGVQVFIGGESDVLPYDGVSLISAPYTASSGVIGVLGVIGPSRMAYERVIPLVDVTAKFLSRAMGHKDAQEP